jgi:hypothetical protein
MSSASNVKQFAAPIQTAVPIPNTVIPNYDLFKTFGFLFPIFLGVFMIMSSFFNQDLKGLIWLLGSLVCCSIIYGVQRLKWFKTLTAGACSNPFIQNKEYNSPSMSSAFIIFTVVYLFIPMYTMSSWNFFVVGLLLWFFIFDALFKIQTLCTPLLGVIMGTLIGGGVGLLYYGLIQNINPKLVYYQMSSSNKDYCSKPKDQQFKCSVYKNGEFISTL